MPFLGEKRVALGTPAENCLREQFTLERQDTADSWLEPAYKLLQAVGPEALLVASSQVCKPLLSGECTPRLPPIFCPLFPCSLIFWALWVAGFRYGILFYSHSMLFLRSTRSSRSRKQNFALINKLLGRAPVSLQRDLLQAETVGMDLPWTLGKNNSASMGNQICIQNAHSRQQSCG